MTRSEFFGELKNPERRTAGNKLDVGLERLVKERYATTPKVPEILYSITTKRRCMRPRERLERRQARHTGTVLTRDDFREGVFCSSQMPVG
jgi:hypothetical protein